MSSVEYHRSEILVNDPESKKTMSFSSSQERMEDTKRPESVDNPAFQSDIFDCQEMSGDCDNDCNHVKKEVETAQEDMVVNNNSIDNTSPPVETIVEPATPRLFKRRWLMLLLFATYSGSNAYQWLHLVIVSDKIIFYYNASLPSSELGQQYAVDFLSMIYMIVYVPLIFPATWMLDKKGLRLTAIVGCFLNALGALIKCFAVRSNLFWLLFFAQTICAVAQVFILGIPTRLAAVWFGINEVSTATAIGVFGNQIGTAVGFVVPPEVVTSDNFDFVGRGLSLMMYVGAGFTALLFILVLVFFQNNPPVPPSHAQVTASNTWSNEDYCGSIRRLMTNVGFALLVITYGINTGSYYAISTLLNSFVIYYFPGETGNAGNIGLTLVIAGIFGSVLAGIWLDKTKHFKVTTVAIYVLSFAGMITYTFTLNLNHIWVVFLCSGFLGFFMTGYLPVGFEFAAELTFPESEGTSSGLLNASAQVFGIILTLGVRALTSLPNGMLIGNLTICGVLLIGSFVTGLIKADLRRQAAQRKKLTESAAKDVAKDDNVEFSERSDLGNIDSNNECAIYNDNEFKRNQLEVTSGH